MWFCGGDSETISTNTRKSKHKRHSFRAEVRGAVGRIVKFISFPFDQLHNALILHDKSKQF